MPTIYIHIGHEKTGTTAIQEFLYENRESLKEQGILYPELGWQKFVQSSLVNSIHHLDNHRHLEFFPEGIDENPELVWGKLKEAALEWRKDIFLSSEHFISRLGNKGINYIKNYLDSHLSEYKVKIIVYLRRQDECFSSRLSTLAKAGAKNPISFWVNEVMSHANYYDYYNLLSLWSKSFGKEAIIVREYSKNIDVTKDIQGLIGVDISCDKKMKSNSSWHPFLVHIAFKINKLFEDMDVNERRFRLSKLNELMMNNQDYASYSRSPLIDDNLARKIIELYRDSNEKLSNDFNNGNALFKEYHRKSENSININLSDDILIKMLFDINT